MRWPEVLRESMNMGIKFIRCGVWGVFLFNLVFSGLLYGETILPTQDITESDSGWSSSSDTNSVVQSFGIVIDAEKGNVLKLEYDIGEGSWVAFSSPSFSTTFNLSAQGDAFSFYYQGEGLSNKLVMEVKDINGQVYKSSSVDISTRTSGWVLQNLAFSDFTFAFNAEGKSMGDSFDWTQVKNIGFTVEPVSGVGGAGTVAIDELTITTVATPTASEQMVDDGEDGSLNNLNSAFGQLGTSTITQVNNPTPFEGTYCREISTTSITDSGMYELIYQNGTSTQPLDISDYSHLSFYLQISAPVSGNIDVLLKDNSAIEKRLTVQDYFADKTIPVGSWERVLIPLNDFSSDSSMDLTNMGELLFYLPVNTTVYLDKISFNTITSTPQPDYLLDSMDTYYTNSSWNKAEADKTTVTLSSISGRQGNAIQLVYQFPNSFVGQWANMNRGFGLNVLSDNANAFRFDYKGSGGNNDLEFKIIDDNDTTFRFVLPDVTDTNSDWKTVTVLYDDMAYFTGNVRDFNFKNVRKVEFALAKGEGGKGELYVDHIQYFKQPDFIKNFPANRLITDFTVDNNPFAPQTASANSRAVFTFTLTESAKVWLKFYDLTGSTVLKIDAGTLNAGGQSITWDGFDRYGKLVRNGLYLYQLVAEGQSGVTQRIKNIIAVVR